MVVVVVGLTLVCYGMVWYGMVVVVGLIHN